MLNHREIRLIRTALAFRMGARLQDKPEEYQEHIELLEKLWKIHENLKHDTQSPISPQYAAELSKQVGELEAENELLQDEVSYWKHKEDMK